MFVEAWLEIWLSLSSVAVAAPIPVYHNAVDDTRHRAQFEVLGQL